MKLYRIIIIVKMDVIGRINNYKLYLKIYSLQNINELFSFRKWEIY